MQQLITNDQELEAFLESSRRILSADKDSWFERKLDWFINNFDGPQLREFVEDLVENCLDLCMRESMNMYVRRQLRFQQQGIFEKDCTHRKLTKPTVRWSGLPDRITYRFQCTDCHDFLVNQRDGCRCPGLPDGEHDNSCNPECRKTCVERFGTLEVQS